MGRSLPDPGLVRDGRLGWDAADGFILLETERMPAQKTDARKGRLRRSDRVWTMSGPPLATYATSPAGVATYRP
jgi:hypothetical protein